MGRHVACARLFASAANAGVGKLQSGSICEHGAEGKECGSGDICKQQCEKPAISNTLW